MVNKTFKTTTTFNGRKNFNRRQKWLRELRSFRACMYVFIWNGRDCVCVLPHRHIKARAHKSWNGTGTRRCGHFNSKMAAPMLFSRHPPSKQRTEGGVYVSEYTLGKPRVLFSSRVAGCCQGVENERESLKSKKYIAPLSFFSITTKTKMVAD